MISFPSQYAYISYNNTDIFSTIFFNFFVLLIREGSFNYYKNTNYVIIRNILG